MREILFRGKRTDNGKWECGDLLSPNEFNAIPHIVYIDYLNEYGDIGEISTPVIPETVGQYTGLTDKNGVRIFEGDILAANFDEDFPEMLTIAEVVWNEYGWCTKEGSAVPDAFDDSSGDLFEIIGNIHDNLELLEGGEGNG